MSMIPQGRITIHCLYLWGHLGNTTVTFKGSLATWPI